MVDQWITDHMGKGKGDVVNVDITTEMKKATIWSIGKTLFGYNFLAEETEWTLHSVFKIVKQFGSCKKSPVRKSHIGIFFWAAKQKALHCVQYMLWLVQNVLEARHNKLVEEQMKVVVLNELNTLRRYETIGGADALISDMTPLFSWFDTPAI